MFPPPPFSVIVEPGQALNKKENKGSESPELESALILTPRTEEKYKQINEEFDHMIKTHKIPVSTEGATPSLSSFSMATVELTQLTTVVFNWTNCTKRVRVSSKCDYSVYLQ